MIEINKVLNEKASLKLIPEAIGTKYLNHHGTNTDEPFIDIISNQIAHLMTIAPRSTILTNELNKLDNARKIAEVIQYYISYGDLLKVVIEKGRSYPLVDEIIKILTTDYFGFTQSLSIKYRS